MPHIAHANSGHENFFLIPPDGFDETTLRLPVEEYHGILPDMILNLKTLLYKPIDPSIIPTHLLVSIRLPSLPELMQTSQVGWLCVVSYRLRALFEELEPGGTPDCARQILRSPDDAYAGLYFYLVPQTLAQGMLPERSPAVKIEDHDDGWRGVLAGRSRCLVRCDAQRAARVATGRASSSTAVNEKGPLSPRRPFIDVSYRSPNFSGPSRS